MAFACPFLKLPAETTTDHLDGLLKYKRTGRIYFNATAKLDYFDFFLNRGTSHEPTPLDMITDLEIGNCNWKVDNRSYHWPMVRTDCVLAANAVKIRALAIAAPEDLDGLQAALENYKGVSTYMKNEALLFALSMLSGNGTVTQNGPSGLGECFFPPIGTEHRFGAYYGKAT